MRIRYCDSRSGCLAGEDYDKIEIDKNQLNDAIEKYIHPASKTTKNENLEHINNFFQIFCKCQFTVSSKQGHLLRLQILPMRVTLRQVHDIVPMRIDSTG